MWRVHFSHLILITASGLFQPEHYHWHLIKSGLQTQFRVGNDNFRFWMKGLVTLWDKSSLVVWKSSSINDLWCSWKCTLSRKGIFRSSQELNGCRKKVQTPPSLLSHVVFTTVKYIVLVPETKNIAKNYLGIKWWTYWDFCHINFC